MKEDRGIEWVRKARHEISARFEHDPKRVLQYYKELQKEYESQHLKSPAENKPAEPVGT